MPVLGELDRWLLAEGAHRRAWERLGAHLTQQDGVAGATFAVWAPSARRASVVGDFNDWEVGRTPLTPSGDTGVWEAFVPGVVAGQRYKLAFESQAGETLPLKADPYAFFMELAPGNASIVHSLAGYEWHDSEWLARRGAREHHTAPVSIYELHLGSWRRHGSGRWLTYRELAEQLVPYLLELGFTHVELLPVSEHPLYGSWGYQPLGCFAPTARYGTPEDFKALVDALHVAGLGVIIDWVPAHFPEDEHGLARFDGTHLYEHADPRQGRHQDWGTLVYNYGRAEVQNFLIANALFWLREYHVDGLRVDAVASMLYLDYSRAAGEWIPNRHGGNENLEAVEFLRRLNEVVYAEVPGVMTIAEESTAWPGVSRPTSSGGLGFGFKWNMGWMHDVRRYLGCPVPARHEHHDEITFSMLYQGSENFVLSLSHDEVVHGKRSLLWSMAGTREEQFANLRLLYGWQWLHAGKKLLFMGSELAQDREWAHERELDWALLEHAPHAGVQRWVRDLNALYRRLPALHAGDASPGGFTWIDCADRRHSVLSVLRVAEGAPPAIGVLNFGGETLRSYRVGAPCAGAWREALNSDAVAYGGRGEGNLGRAEARSEAVQGQPACLELTLPALSALVLVPGSATGT